MKLATVFDTDDETAALYSWLFKRDSKLIDNVVFYLHYHVTVAIFFIGCLIVTVTTYIMDPIECISESSVDEVIDNYCLYHSTYTVGVGDNGKILAPHPGVSSVARPAEQDQRFHHYYLWVAVVLALQAVSFYIPRGFWKSWEGTRVSIMLDEINEKENFISSSVEGGQDGDNLKQKKSPLVEYIASGNHNFYYGKLLFCEVLNLTNVLVQLLIIDYFFGFGLYRLNIDYLQLLRETRPFERADAVDQIFPKVTKCVFYSFGPGGGVQNFDALCVLSVNAINEKLFIVLCTWLLLLAALSFLAVLYRLSMLVPMIRNALLNLHLQPDENTDKSLKHLNKELNIGNWQLLCQLGGNSGVDSFDLTSIVKALCEFKQDKKHS